MHRADAVQRVRFAAVLNRSLPDQRVTDQRVALGDHEMLHRFGDLFEAEEAILALSVCHEDEPDEALDLTGEIAG